MNNNDDSVNIKLETFKSYNAVVLEYDGKRIIVSRRTSGDYVFEQHEQGIGRDNYRVTYFEAPKDAATGIMLAIQILEEAASNGKEDPIMKAARELLKR